MFVYVYKPILVRRRLLSKLLEPCFERRPGKVNGLLLVGGCSSRAALDPLVLYEFPYRQEEPRGEKVRRFCCDGETQIEQEKERTKPYMSKLRTQNEIYF